jgi:negative regulator of flagellin synthesis FlgM
MPWGGAQHLKIEGQQTGNLLRSSPRQPERAAATHPQTMPDETQPNAAKPADRLGRDTVVFSARARDVQKARKAALDAPEVRQDKVADVARRIADGSYDVPPEKVADALLRQARPQGKR